MSNKLVLQDLVDLLAKKSKITKKEADSFFRELFQLILDRIFENDSVKIKDFGTFKLVMVSSRESVDVNTGEKIEIRAHSKLSFIPDKTLKNLVNKPFSQFETILLEDGVNFDVSFDSDHDPASPSRDLRGDGQCCDLTGPCAWANLWRFADLLCLMADDFLAGTASYPARLVLGRSHDSR